MNNSFNLPLFACDCHTHVVGHRDKYPLIKNLIYLPQEANTDDITKFLSQTNLKRVVLVQPSFYGTDNSYLEHSLIELKSIARGIAVVDSNISNNQIDILHSAGVRGIRINPSTFENTDIKETEIQIQKSIKIVERNGWHIQFFLKPETIIKLKNIIKDLPVNIVFDHCGFMTKTSQNSDEFKFFISLLEKGKSWIKLSAPYRLTTNGTFGEMSVLIKKLIQINPDRLLWGSDWPHTPKHNGLIAKNPKELPYRKFDIPARIKELSEIINEATIFDKIMQDNPGRLYDFNT